MAIGKRKSGGDFLPMLKYDARAGTLFLQDRVYENGGWQNKQRDITKNFRAAFDLENLQRGWIRFPKGAAPEMRLVRIGEDPGNAPSIDYFDDDLPWREGLRCLAKMDASLGGDVRELLSTAVGLWHGLDALHDDYLAGIGEHSGALPVTDLAGTTKLETPAGISFTPVFKIVGWIPRPPDLPLVEAARPAPKQNSKVAAPAESNTGDGEVLPF